jgi:hypothetical protein
MNAEEVDKVFTSIKQRRLSVEQLLVWADAKEEIGECDKAERLRCDAECYAKSWYGKVLAPFLESIVRQLSEVGFDAERYLQCIVVHGRAYHASETRRGRIRFCGSVYHGKSTRSAMKNLIGWIGRDLRDKERDAEEERVEQYRESLQEAMLR